MGREWFAVYGAILMKAKYRRLSPPARGALLHVFALATIAEPEATWPNGDALIELLKFDGFTEAIYDELLAQSWLDVDDDGRVWVHDWDDHQLAATERVRRAYEAARKRTWRRTKGQPRSQPPSSGALHPTEQYTNGTEHHSGPGHVSDMSETPFDLDAYDRLVKAKMREQAGLPPERRDPS